MNSAMTIPALTGLRGVAACWVVLYHIFANNPSPIRFGFFAVDVFFILSGFVLSHVYARQFQRPDAAAYFSFIKARVARIFPLNIFILLVLAATVLFLPGFYESYPSPQDRFGLSAFIAEAFLIQNWFHWMPLAWNGVAWSLSAEWAAYIVFPVFVVMTQRWKSIYLTIALAFLSLAGLIALFRTQGIYTPDAVGTPGMARMALEFCCGCLLFRAKDLGFPKMPLWVDGATLSLIAASFVITGAVSLSLFGIAIIVLLASQDDSLVAKTLSVRPLVFLGEISYSIYMVHWTVIQISKWAAGTGHLSPLQIAGEIWLTLMISYGTYSMIELRARAWARKLGSKNQIAYPEKVILTSSR